MNRLAFVLYGHHYLENKPFESHEILRKNKCKINYQNSLSNYKEKIFNYFNNQGYSIDIFIATYDSKLKDELLKDYKPVNYIFKEPTKVLGCGRDRDYCRNISVSTGIKLVLDYSKKTNIKYNNVFITRFDLIFKKNLEDSNINMNDLQITSPITPEPLIDDNIYFMPFKYLDIFYNIILNNIYVRGHDLYPYIKKQFKVSYIYDERAPNKRFGVGDLTFFKILRQDNVTNIIYEQLGHHKLREYIPE